MDVKSIEEKSLPYAHGECKDKLVDLEEAENAKEWESTTELAVRSYYDEGEAIQSVGPVLYGQWSFLTLRESLLLEFGGENCITVPFDTIQSSYCIRYSGEDQTTFILFFVENKVQKYLVLTVDFSAAQSGGFRSDILAIASLKRKISPKKTPLVQQ